VLCIADSLDEDESGVHIDNDSFHLYTDESFRTCTTFDWILKNSSDQEIDSGLGSLRLLQTAVNAEVVAIENEISTLFPC
jgi:hypothetical protein